MCIFEVLKGLTALPMEKYKQSFVSGDQQECIKIKYYFNRENGHLYAKVFWGELAQGPPNHVHGGAIASVLDEAMGAAAWMNGHPSLTSRLKVDFHRPIELKSEVLVYVWVDRVNGKRLRLKGEMRGSNKILCAKCEGLFIVQTKERFQRMGDIPDEFFLKGPAI